MADGIGTVAVINYKTNIDNVKRNVKLIESINKTMAKKLGSEFAKGVTIVKNELTKISTSAKKIKLGLGKSTNELRTFTTVVKTANGKLFTLTRTVAGTGRNIRTLNTKVSAGAAGLRTFGQNLATLAKRAALTIPLWFALRQGIGSVFRVMKQGLTDIIALDRALQKAKRNLQGTTENIARNFATLRTEVTKLSIETGRSTEEITNAFQKFATVGFDFETSLAGANFATKTAILLFGDGTATANAFARSMRVLADRSKDAKPISEQLGIVMAETVELWKTNAFEINEFTSALERFSPVAKTAGFSAGESAKIVATLGTAALRGSRGGRLLATSITRLVTKTDELAKSLGIKVNPEVDRTFDVFLKVLDALDKTRSSAGKISPAFEKITKSIFGLRSSQAIKGLISLNKELKKNLAITGDVAKFNKEFEELNETLPQLVDRFRNLNKEIGKGFVLGLIGGKDFEDSLSRIIDLFAEIQKRSVAIGKLLNFSAKFAVGNRQATNKELSKAIDILFEDFINKLRGTEIFAAETFKRISAGIQGQLSKIETQELIVDIKEENVKIPEDLVDTVNSALKTRLEEFDAPLVVDVQAEVSGVKINISQQNKLIEALIQDQLKRLKLEGATKSQILKIEDALRRQHSVNDDIVAQKTRQLDIERAITAEQKARISFSSESAKLAEIAKTEGLQTAVAINEVLDGTRDFNIFMKQGGDRAKILNEQFADFVKNQELLKFFEGKGVDIKIKELPDTRGLTPITKAKVDFELTKASIGLKDATVENTVVARGLITAMEQLRINFNAGGTVTAEQILTAKRIDSTIKIDLNIGGSNLSFKGTPEEIKESASRMAPEIIPILERAIAHTLKTNNNADLSKAVDERTNKF